MCELDEREHGQYYCGNKTMWIRRKTWWLLDHLGLKRHINK